VPSPSRRVLVAVDGPSGSGKSSVSREVARRAGLAYLDTGAMYRAGCWAALRDGVDVTDGDAAAAVARAVVVDLSTDPDVERVVVDGVDVTDAIRGRAVTAAVSAFAAHPPVRDELRVRQRHVMEASPTGCIAEGRDITTVVAPDADVRILLTADPEARVDRRARQLDGRGSDAAREPGNDPGAARHRRPQTDGGGRDVRAAVLDRDAADSRVTSFLTAADGVVPLDSSGLDFEQTVAAVLDLVLDAQRAPADAP
jgi:CMP/dCMP kinase